MKPLTWKKGRSLLPVVRKFGVFDWLLVVCVTVCAHVLRFSNFPADFSGFACSDVSSPVRTETISYLMVAVFVYVLGSLACAFLWLTQRRDISLLRVLCAYFFAVSVTVFIGSVIQLVVGRPLPDTLAVCGGDGSFAQCAQVLSAGELRAQFKSFPNVEVAEASAAATFLVLMLTEVWPGQSMFSALATFFPAVFALFVAGCAILDRRARPDDAVIGIFIGTVASWITWITFWDAFKQNNDTKSNPLGTRTVTSSSGISMRGYM